MHDATAISRGAAANAETSMISRISAVVAGLIAGGAAFYFIDSATGARVVWARASGPAAEMAGALANRPDRLAWAAAMAATAFGIVALAIAGATGLWQTFRTRRRLQVLRREAASIDRGGGDWRAAFAGTVIAIHAEAAGGERRAIADLALLTGLEALWLDRLALTRTIAPLPMLALGFGAVTALFDVYRHQPWAIALMAGAMGWLLIGAAGYLARTLLGWAVSVAIDAAIAASIATAPTLQPAMAGAAGPRDGDDSDGDQDYGAGVDPAMREVRAGIERLLAGSRTADPR
jgi:hypothetical protein